MVRWPFLAALGALVIGALPGEGGVPPDAPPPKPRAVRRIGFLAHVHKDDLAGAFRKRMAELGYVEGRDVLIQYRNGEGRIDELPRMAGEFVQLDVDLIVASGSPAVRAAYAATKTIPIVMVSVGVDPMQLGVVKSLARPGGNVTGVVTLGTEIWAKRLQLFREMVPRVTRAAVLWNPANPGNVLAEKEVRAACAGSGIRLTLFPAKDAAELEAALVQVARDPPEALICIWDSFSLKHSRRIADFAIQNRLPTLTPMREYAEGGALMSYGTNLPAQYRKAADYVDRILKGANPADMPVELPLDFELVINRKTAKALGLAIPPDLLVLADKVIE